MTEQGYKYHSLAMFVLVLVMLGWIIVDTHIDKSILRRLEAHVKDGHPYDLQELLDAEGERLNRKIEALQTEVKALESELIKSHREE